MEQNNRLDKIIQYYKEIYKFMTTEKTIFKIIEAIDINISFYCK